MITKQKYESLQALQMYSLEHRFKIYGNLGKKNNRFESISLPEKDYIFGLAYYNHGIDSQGLLLDNASKLIVGFDHYILGLDCEAKAELIQKESIAPFYEFIETENRILAICELDIFAFDLECRLIWSSGFRDIVENYEVIDGKIVSITCSNGDKNKFELSDGKAL